jgi:selenocysteine lyase/cysteine desulfurase
MYAYRLAADLGIDTNDGVVRLSAVHYNTMDEIEKCIQALDAIL